MDLSDLLFSPHGATVQLVHLSRKLVSQTKVKPLKTCPECHSDYDDSIDRCPKDNTRLTAIERDPLVGSKLADRYEIVSVIGRGGMGVVYKARQEQMDKYMAIKMLHSHMVADSEAVKRFYREAKTVSQVRHHHIVTLYDFGMSSQGQPFLVMDYLEGRSLKDGIKERGPVPFDKADILFKQIVDALASAHTQDVVHRDLKPENIVISKHGEQDWVTLVDFGLSKLREPSPKAQDAYQITKIGDVCGSPPYMSPEQCLSASTVDPRSDIYSLAVVAYESLAGKLPFQAKSAIEMMDCHLYATPIPFNQAQPELKLCTELTQVFNKALQKDAANRQQTIQEFGNELHEALKRDGLKLRTMKHRLEGGFADMAAEAEAIQTGTYEQIVSLKISGGDAPDGLQFIADATPGGAGTRTDSVKLKARPQNGNGQGGDDDDEEEEEGDEPQGFLAKLMSLFGGGRRSGDGVDDDDDDEVGGDIMQCPYCGTTVKSRIRFCINCQRQLLSPQEVAKLRIQQGKFTLPKAQGGKEGKGFSRKAKSTMNRSTQLSLFQKVLTVILIASIAYGVLSAMKNPALMKRIKSLGSSITQMQR